MTDFVDFDEDTGLSLVVAELVLHRALLVRLAEYVLVVEGTELAVRRLVRRVFAVIHCGHLSAPSDGIARVLRVRCGRMSDQVREISGSGTHVSRTPPNRPRSA